MSCEYMPLEWRMQIKINVPCGKCEACQSKRRQQWSFRLFQELKYSESCYFITLTYDDQHLPLSSGLINGTPHVFPVVDKKDVQNFLKRLRKHIEPFKIRYFLVSEYGPRTYRPHYHMLLFNFPNLLKQKLDGILIDAWSNGFTRVDPVSNARIHYVTSYCLDSSTLPKHLPKNFMLCSRKPGIGSQYLDNYDVVNFHLRNLDNTCYLSNTTGVFKTQMPRYYSDKLFSDEQKHKISLENSTKHNAKDRKLRSKQKRWLTKHGKECTDTNLKTPFPGSPLDQEIQKVDEFKAKVKRKCKMKKDV